MKVKVHFGIVLVLEWDREIFSLTWQELGPIRRYVFYFLAGNRIRKLIRRWYTTNGFSTSFRQERFKKFQADDDGQSPAKSHLFQIKRTIGVGGSQIKAARTQFGKIKQFSLLL